MLTAVLERQGPLIRFNEAFLQFLLPFKALPYACNKGQAHEKGKVENVIGYIRKNFWPLRSFRHLLDVQEQADHWRDQVANVRIHQTTGERPLERFQPDRLRPLPKALPDVRETACPRVSKDFAIPFDANYYTVPPWAVSRRVTVKATLDQVYIYHLDQLIATHHRTWERRRRIEAPEHVAEARKNLGRQWRSDPVVVLLSLGPEVKDYLEHMVGSGMALKKNVQKMLVLKDEYGPQALIEAVSRAADHKAYGADYIENILHREMRPRKNHAPVKLQHKYLNDIQLEETSLADFDSFVLKRRREDDPNR